MNLREADLAPELALNEILWQSVHGAGSVMPPPRRTGFIRPIAEDDEDEVEEAREGKAAAQERDSR
jgi:hypothetical protein